MMRSHVIEVDGVFVGAAIQDASGYKFVAVAPELTPLNGSILATLQDTRRLATDCLRTLAQKDGLSKKPGPARPGRI